MNSVCEDCNKAFKSKWHLRRHLNRKVPCYKTRPQKSVSLRNHCVTDSSSLCNPNVIIASSFRGTGSDTLNHQENYVCEYCERSYNHRQNRHRHLQICEKRIEKLENLNRVKYLIEMLENHQKIQEKNSQKMLKNVKKCKKKIKNVKKSNNNNNLNNSTISNNLDNFKFNDKDLQLLNNFISNYNLQHNNPNNNSNNNPNNNPNNNSNNNPNNNPNNFISNNNNLTNNSNNTNNNTLNNNTTNNNTININIRAFGNENLDSLTKKDKINILNKSYNSFMESLEKVHYNIPENRNFFQPNKNKDYVEYYNGDNWIYENQDKFTDILSTKMITRLETWFDMYKQRLTSTKRQLIQQMIEEYSSGKIDTNLNQQTKKYLLSYSNNIKHFMDNEINNIGTIL
jgi:hypothetical protein